MNRKEWFRLVLAEIEKKFDRGNSFQWRSVDFEDLSNEISNETKVMVSKSTLRRIFGNVPTNEQYFPQQATIKALVEYSGVTIKEPRENNFNSDGEEQNQEERDHYPSNKLNIFQKIGSFYSEHRLLSSIIVTLSISFLAFIVVFIYSNLIETKAKLKLTKMDERLSYMSAYFSCQLPNTPDSVFFDHNDGKPWIYLPKGTEKISYFFTKPGVHYVKIRTRNKILSDSIFVLTQTNGWEMNASYFNAFLWERDFNIPSPEFYENGCIHVSKKMLAKNGVDTNRFVITRLDNFKKTNQNADNFITEFIIKNTVFWPTVRCNAIVYTVVAEKGIIRFNLMKNGCSVYTSVRLGEKNFYGDSEELSDFYFSLEEFKKMKIINRNKEVTFLLEDKEVFKQKYESTLGNLMGITIVFQGSGYIKSLKLNTPNLKEPLFVY